MGWPPSWRKKARAAAARCSGGRGFAPCPKPANTLHLGADADPEVYYPTLQVKAWTVWWGKMDKEERQRTARAWFRARTLLEPLAANRRWERVRGPISATVVTLLEHGWEPLTPAYWRYSGWEARLEAGAVSAQSILSFFEQEAQTRSWQRAAAHFAGKGLERGVPSFDVVKRIQRTLRKKGEYADAGLVEAIALGGNAACERINGICGLCRGTDISPLHRYWTCSALRELQDPALADSQDLEALVTGPYCGRECLRARGLVPALDAPDEEPTRLGLQHTWVVGDFGAASRAQGAAFSDGGGAPGVTPRPLGRVGAGSVAFDLRWEDDGAGDEGKPHLDQLAFVIAPVQHRQTAPRAELVGATNSYTRAAQGAYLGIDASYVTKGLGGSTTRSLRRGSH